MRKLPIEIVFARISQFSRSIRLGELGDSDAGVLFDYIARTSGYKPLDLYENLRAIMNARMFVELSFPCPTDP